jgi:hypothetical protein
VGNQLIKKNHKKRPIPLKIEFFYLFRRWAPPPCSSFYPYNIFSVGRRLICLFEENNTFLSRKFGASPSMSIPSGPNFVPYFGTAGSVETIVIRHLSAVSNLLHFRHMYGVAGINSSRESRHKPVPCKPRYRSGGEVRAGVQFDVRGRAHHVQ